MPYRSLLACILISIISISGCGGGDTTDTSKNNSNQSAISSDSPNNTNQSAASSVDSTNQIADIISESTIDTTLTPEPDQVVSQLVDTIVEGVQYTSMSSAGSIYEGSTNSIGQFITYPGGNTQFKIGDVNIGGWHEPDSNINSTAGSIVQLHQLTYNETSCSSANAETTAQILLGINSYNNSYHITIPDSKTLQGCPQDQNFITDNNIKISDTYANDHIVTTMDRLDIQAKIASELFNIPLADIKKKSIGVNFNYNNYGEHDEGVSTCTGYAGGHAGVDFQTKDTAGAATADREVYSLTDGKVLKTDAAKGRVIISATLEVNGSSENVKIGYLHLRSIAVAEGDIIKKGSHIGIQGNLGLGLNKSDITTQEHVHVEIRSSDAPTGAACGASPSGKIGSLDPLKYFSAIVGGSTKTILDCKSRMTDAICENFNDSINKGTGFNIKYTPSESTKGLKFSKNIDSRVEYNIDSSIPSSGTVEMFVKVDSAYYYDAYSEPVLKENSCAPLFMTDWADVTWPGSAHFFGCNDGKLYLEIADSMYGVTPWQKTEATNTSFAFGKWVRVGFSYGKNGQSISVNGVVVASSPNNTQILGSGGTHSSPSGIATIGEFSSKFFDPNLFEGGYEGVIDWIRVSPVNNDWLK